MLLLLLLLFLYLVSLPGGRLGLFWQPVVFQVIVTTQTTVRLANK